MADIWNRVHKLKGRTLRTLARSKPFKIVAVLSDRVQFVPDEGCGTLRWFPRKDIEYIVGLGLERDEIRTRLLREWPNDQNSSYVAAIVYEVTRSGSV